MPKKLELLAESALELTDSEQVPDNIELPAETNFVLASCEQTHSGKVNLTQSPLQTSEINLEAIVLQTQHQ